MRISFDLDSTLIPAVPDEFPVETAPRHRLLSLVFREQLRAGTVRLFRTLRAQGHEPWIYTTSNRSSVKVWLWFLLSGARVSGVVNSARHQKAAGVHAVAASKLPSAFAIDLHVDDSAGVALEGRRFNFRVCCVGPHSKAWAAEVLAAVSEARAA